MEITREAVCQLISMMPGYAVAYLIQNGIHRLCYTKELPKLSGYTPEEYAEVSKGEASDLIFAEDRAATLQQLQNAINKGTEVECGYRVLHKDGSTVHVAVRAREIGKLDGAPVFLTVLNRVSLDSLQLDMINRIPVGMGIYEVENGIPALVYLNDSYYCMMGFSREDRTGYLGSSTINAVHPDDRASILAGIQQVLSGETNQFCTVIRMVMKNPGEYHWLQLEGRIAKRTGVVSTFYVSFTKIDELQNAKAELEKSRAFMQSAMEAANIQYFEYYPAEHLAIGHDNSALFGLPQRVENYPDSLFETGVFHPEEMARLRKMFAEVDKGCSPVTWEGRIRANGKYRWYSCVMTSARDIATGQLLVACTLFDITVQKEAEQSYHNHLDSIMRANPDAISTFRMNLTDNICEDGYSIYENILKLKNGGTVDEFFSAAESYIPDADGRARFHAAFARRAMLESFADGKKRITVEHRYQLAPEDTEWITTTMDLMMNPATGDVEAVLYSLNTNAAHMEHVILQDVLQRSYDAISVVDVRTDEYFMYERLTNTNGQHLTHFTAQHDAAVQRYLSAEEWAHLAPQLGIAAVKEGLRAQGSYAHSYFVKTPQGTQRKHVSYYYIDKERHTLLASLRDFSDRDLLEQFRHTSEHDRVTNLYNRQKTFSACRKMLEKHPDESFYVCHMDIQRFHLINSFYGEAEGNALLTGIARVIEQCAQDFPYAVYGRIEADAFLIFVPAQKDVLERDVRIMKEWLRGQRKNFMVEANFGAYRVCDRSMPIEAMYARATFAAKNSHESLLYHYSYYDEAMEATLQREQQITNDMQTALEQEQFAVYLQPKYLLKNGTPCGAEALVRWLHPEKGLIPPNDFIPLFEKNGFIIQLDRYMWEHVCMLLRRWLDEGREPSPISVNVSRVSMYSPTTVSFLNELVDRYRLPHALLQLELTESAYMDDPEEMKKRLLTLQKDGFTILMDDFGSGYSSLNTLRELPVDYLKIDMRFLSKEEDSDRSRLILASVVRMACWLNLPVITEGVETAEQKEFLNGIGCTYAQGFLFARPMPVEQYEREVLQRQTIAAALPGEHLPEIVKLISDAGEGMRLLTEHLPVPMALVDTTEADFAYLRANREFQTAFGHGCDIVDKTLLLQNHLTAQDHEALSQAYRLAAQAQGKASCAFSWVAQDGTRRRYLMQAQYLGKSGYSEILLAVFADLTGC